MLSMILILRRPCRLEKLNQHWVTPQSNATDIHEVQLRISTRPDQQIWAPGAQLDGANWPAQWRCCGCESCARREREDSCEEAGFCAESKPSGLLKEVTEVLRGNEDAVHPQGMSPGVAAALKFAPTKCRRWTNFFSLQECCVWQSTGADGD